MADGINIRIGLSGDAEIKKKLDDIRGHGEKFGHDISKSLNQAVGTNPALGKAFGAEEGIERSREAAERLREVVHTLHPILESAGLGLGNLGSFARVAGAGMSAFAAAIVGSVILGLSKLGDETQKTKLHLNALGSSGDAFDKLNERAKKLGVSTAALVPGLEQYRAAVNKTDADLTKTVSHPPGYKPNETEPDVRIIGGGKETGARVPAETFLTAHSALIASGQSEKISGDEAAKQADAFEKKLLDNRHLTSDAVRELSPSAANNLAKALEPFFGTSLKDGAALVAHLDRPGAHKPTDNETLRALAKSEPSAAKQAEAAKGVTAGFEAVGAASKRLAEKLAGDGTAIGKALTGTAKVIDAIAAAEHKSDAGSGLAASATPPLLDFLKRTVASKPPNQRVAEEFDQLQPKSPGKVAAPEGTPISRALDLKADVRKASDVAVSNAAGATPVGPIVPKFNDDGSLNPYGGLPNNRPIPNDGYTNPYGQAPHNEAERRQQQHENAVIRKQEAENQKLFNKNIHDQGGRPSLDKENYAPPVLGHYDRDMNFVANPKQPARDPNAVPGAPFHTTFPAYDRKLTKEFQDKYGASMNPPGVENPFQGTAPPDVNLAPGQNPGDAPPKRIYIGLSAEEERKRNEEDLQKIQDERKRREQDRGDGYAEGGQAVRMADGGEARLNVSPGGHLSGPGAGKSDSIKADVANGEFVVNAEDTAKNLAALHDINSGKMRDGHYVAGGRVSEPSDGVHFAGGGQVSAQTHLSAGPHQITYDPVTGGAYIDGALHLPGDPLLNDPIVKEEIDASLAGANQKQAPEKHKSQFIGDYGESALFAKGGLVGNFAEGGVVGSSPIARLHHVLSRFAGGGKISIPQFDLGLPDLHSPAIAASSALNGSSAGTGPLHPVTLNLPGGGSIDGFHAQPSAVAQLRDEASKAKRYSTGPKPSWYGGGGK